MQLFHNTFAMEDSAIVVITRKLVNAYQVLVLTPQWI